MAEDTLHLLRLQEKNSFTSENQGVAFANPEVEAVGVDNGQQMIVYAQMQAELQGLTNAQFRVMDIQQPLDFPDNYFDLVNTRQTAFLPLAAWPPFLRECLCIAQPDGIIRLTETHGNISTSSTNEQMGLLFFYALRRTGQSFSPTGQHLGIAPMITQLSLSQSG
jgi:ubiquinone/menaquinone biosynthesis C-methylase UbiE